MNTDKESSDHQPQLNTLEEVHKEFERLHEELHMWKSACTAYAVDCSYLQGELANAIAARDEALEYIENLHNHSQEK